jgi:hypothetical protein
MKKRLTLLALVIVLTGALAAPVPAAIKIAKIYYDSPGPENGSNASLNGEWIRLKNTGGAARSLRGWKIRDAAGHEYKFGAYRLRAGRKVIIHTGSGANSSGNRYWGRGNYVWNNDQDTARLRRSNGTLADSCHYNNPSANFKVCLLDATPPPTGDPVVAAAGDVACAPPGTRSDTACHQQDTADLIKAINPDKVLMLGDAQYETGTLANINAVYNPSWGAFKAKTLGTAGGSHDFYGGGDFFTYFGTTSFPRGAFKPYSYDLGNWHIVSMNSYCEVAEAGGCGTSGTQYTWLQADLEANTKSCILAMWHEPYWTSGYRHDNDTVTRPYMDLLYQHRADVLLVGHEHNYERLWPMRPDGTRDDANGITAFVVGTGGKSLEDAWGTIEPNSASRQRDTYGVLKLTLHAGSFDWQFVPEAGKTFTDTGSSTCH